MKSRKTHHISKGFSKKNRFSKKKSIRRIHNKRGSTRKKLQGGGFPFAGFDKQHFSQDPEEQNKWTLNTSISINASQILKIPNGITLIIPKDIFLENNKGGTILNDGETILKDGGIIDNEGGIINNNEGCVINIKGGTINNNEGSIINNNEGGTINIKGGTIYNKESKIFNHKGGTINNTEGGIINNYEDGEIFNKDGRIYNYKSGTIYNNGGTIFNTDGGIIDNKESGEINNKKDSTINNDGGTINNNQNATIYNNYGTINNYKGGIINNDAESIFVNYGTITNSNSSVINNKGGKIFNTENGTINNYEGGTIFNTEGGKIYNNKHGKINNESGEIVNERGRIVNTEDGALTNDGTLHDDTAIYDEDFDQSELPNINNIVLFIFAHGRIIPFNSKQYTRINPTKFSSVLLTADETMCTLGTKGLEEFKVVETQLANITSDFIDNIKKELNIIQNSLTFEIINKLNFFSRYFTSNTFKTKSEPQKPCYMGTRGWMCDNPISTRNKWYNSSLTKTYTGFNNSELLLCQDITNIKQYIVSTYRDRVKYSKYPKQSETQSFSENSNDCNLDNVFVIIMVRHENITYLINLETNTTMELHEIVNKSFAKVNTSFPELNGLPQKYTIIDIACSSGTGSSGHVHPLQNSDGTYNSQLGRSPYLGGRKRNNNKEK